ncbi:MAG: deoxyribodipyrimidine photo-lyase [Rhodothermales bacterium]
MPTTLVWLSRDLRRLDNPALHEAAQRGRVVPVYVWSPDEEGDWAPGAARRWWLHHSLAALDTDLRDHGSQLILRNGDSLATLRDLIEATGADAVYWNTRYEPALRQRDADIAEALRADGIDVQTFAGVLIHDPDAIRTDSGGPYKVYTPFWKKMTAQTEVHEALGAPRLGETSAPDAWPDSEDLDEWSLLPTIDWDGGLYDTWTPGERGAHDRLERFIDEAAIDYADERNRPDHKGTSMLSPHLHHGEISPRQVWHAVNEWVQNGSMKDAATVFLKEIAWREFSYHLLYHFPSTTDEPLKPKFNAFPWTDDTEALERWQKGQTGYPIVDAGMRQLWHIGWMHNRVRMIVASFLTKDLLVPWQEGATWFWDTLVGADLANNTNGWQWSAGSGADAQPFFRIFNPISQGERFDPNGDYVRTWVPELAKLPKKYVHKPWDAPPPVLAAAGVKLGDAGTYPMPMVDHSEARDVALEAYKKIK